MAEMGIIITFLQFIIYCWLDQHHLYGFILSLILLYNAATNDRIAQKTSYSQNTSAAGEMVHPTAYIERVAFSYTHVLPREEHAIPLHMA